MILHMCEESVTAIACGRITKEDQDELVACTYTGWVFTCSKGSEATATNSSSEAPQVHAINAKMMQLKYLFIAQLVKSINMLCC